MGDRMYGPDGSTNIKDLPEVTDNDLQEMKLMTQIFSEASRIGAFPFINRMCTKDYKIPGKYYYYYLLLLLSPQNVSDPDSRQSQVLHFAL